MNIVVFGGTGRIGSAVVHRALAEGHTVTAVARHEPRTPVRNKHYRLHLGDATEQSVTEAAVAGADVVVLAVGMPGTSSTVVRSTTVSAVLKGMRANGVKRLISVSPAGVVISPKAPLTRKAWLRFIVHKQQRNAYNDVERVEDELVNFCPDIEWSIVRSAKVRETPATNAYQVIPDGQLRNEHPVSVTDLADYLVTRAEDPSTYRTTVTIVGAA
nr:NAD(P)H-binding protein [Kibdelosporangium sp. MJ126-NF4]CEL20100.1 Flavin reductase [Kibdelosporangium sp. MJ126-NF4]CTQ97324.1 Flavin reductase (EC 1.5.1.30) [Kibdelosporangium sp. MJ126-NF4]